MSCRDALWHYSPGILLGLFFLFAGAASWGASRALPEQRPHRRKR